MARILLVDDEPSFLATLTALLRKQEYQVEPLDRGVKALELIKGEEFDLVLTDIRMTPVGGLDLLNVMQEVQPQTPVIMITGDDSVETAVSAMQIGAFDYVTKPFKVDQLFLTVKRALEHHSVVLENLFLRNQLESRYHLDNVVSYSKNMRGVREMVKRVAPTNAPVIITGEAGTGKDMIAKAIHLHSNRSEGPFVPIGCSSMPEDIFAAELFGSAGANAPEKTGLFDAAAGGTIFFDDIEQMPSALQRKIVRVLRERKIEREGNGCTIEIDVRMIGASTKPIEQLSEEGLLIEDLFKIFSVLPIHIDPLRERSEDLIPLISYFIQRENEAGRDTPSLDKTAKQTLENYNWPGNVAELENAMRCALVSVKDNIIRRDDLPADILAATPLPATTISDPDRGRSLKVFLHNKELEYISSVIEGAGGDKRQAAESLNITLEKLEEKLGE